MIAYLRNVRVPSLVLLLPVILCSCAHLTRSNFEALSVENMRCEYRVEPIGLDAQEPRFSWELKSTERGQRQTAYRIFVTESSRKGPLVWDSGRVVSPDAIQIEYAGAPLKPNTDYWWRVEAEGRDGQHRRSPMAHWETGLFRRDDWRGAQWLYDGKRQPEDDAGYYLDDPAPLFRKAFRPSGTVEKARLYIVGVGWYEARLNGERVGDHVLDPAWTNYDKRVFYSVYDVTEQVRGGENCLGVTLGNGWYNPLPLRMWGQRNIREALPTGRPRFLAMLCLEHANGDSEIIVSDPTWRVTDGPVLRNSVYLGEVYDARRELAGWDIPGFDDRDWRPASLAEAPGGVLQSQPLPPIRETALISAPMAITEPAPGTLICDMGINFTGLASFTFTELPAGTKIEFRYGELLHGDGSLNPMTSVAGQIKGMKKTQDGSETPVGGPGAPPVAWQSDTYIAKGGPEETYQPTFTFHAFRYVEITGLPSASHLLGVVGHRLQSDLPAAGTFACADSLLERIDAMCDRTFRSNIMSVQSDCPHRERFGYGGDLVVTSDAFMMHYDMAAFYAKAARDWADAARPGGMLTDTAPFVGIQYCGVAWAMAHPHLLTQLYQYYGDKRLLEEQYPVASQWLDLVAASAPDHIIRKGLNDHEAMESAPAPVMVTPLYCESARMLAAMAETLGRLEDAQKYSALAGAIRDAYVAAYCETNTGKVGPGTQAAQAFALQLDMLPCASRSSALEYLLRYINTESQGRLKTGIFGTNFVLDYLSGHGHADAAYALVNQEQSPGWAFMLANGATTLWEHWEFSDNTYSHNHPMFGSVSQWFYHHVAGIRPAPRAVGFDRAVIAPQPVSGLQHASARYHSIRGEFRSAWKRTADTFTLVVDIPVGAAAEVHLPAEADAKVTESGSALVDAPFVRVIELGGEKVIVEIESGHYEFAVMAPD